MKELVGNPPPENPEDFSPLDISNMLINCTDIVVTALEDAYYCVPESMVKIRTHKRDEMKTAIGFLKEFHADLKQGAEQNLTTPH